MAEFKYVHACPSSTYEDIMALKESEVDVTLETFRRRIGLKQWRQLQAALGYDRDFPISRDWHVGYYRGIYRDEQAYFVRHSGIEYIFTRGGRLGPSLAGEDF
jgi:hypothetical protein